MSWLFSQALVEEFSAGTSLAGEPSAQLNVTPTQHKFWRNDKPMDASDLSRFGLTLRLLTAARGEELLMSYLAAFPARTSAAQAKERALPGSVPDFGAKWQELSAKYSRDTSSWKTHRCLWEEDLPWSSVILPSRGSMRSGHVFQLAALVRHKPGKGSGLLPTLTASDSKGARNGTAKGRDPSDGLTMTDWLWLNVGQGMLHPESAEWTMLWPLGWTDLEPLEMDKFLEWQQQHGDF